MNREQKEKEIRGTISIELSDPYEIKASYLFLQKLQQI